ncbi:MAG TPA: histidine kinase, partial [Flavisolibacter sp.]|nr:histidine kinase [Flavisolibacter sp.]
ACTLNVQKPFYRTATGSQLKPAIILFMNVLNNSVQGASRHSFQGSIRVKDRLLKLLLIPLLGCFIPVFSGLLNYTTLSVPAFLFSLLFFVLLTMVIWQGSVKIVSYLRSRKWLPGDAFGRLFLFLAATVLYGVASVFFMAVLWQLLVLKQIAAPAIFIAIAITALVTALLSLVYEAVFLRAEVDLNAKVMQQLEMERLQAEAATLRNDLDPHFLFNCLNTLSYLVRNDGEQAYTFIHKLSNVFKYLLISKQKQFVPLKEELAFLEDYYYLLQVRFDEAIRIEQDTTGALPEEVTVPGTLQVLVENAIKRNFFSEKEPLVISIALNNQFITVSNPVGARQKKQQTTKGAAIADLRSQYRTLLNQELLTLETPQQYLVKVPRIKKPAA